MSASAFAQIKVDVRQVLVPVIVTGTKGHHVTGLKASDFKILEDGVAQEIVAFSTDTAPAASALRASIDRAPSAPAPDSLRPTFVICIDALHSAAVNSARARDALTHLFEKEKPAGAQFALLSIGRQLQVIQTSTGDASAVLSKLRSAPLGGGDAATFNSELNDLKNRMYDFCKRCACGSARDCDIPAQNLKQSLDAQADHWTLLRSEFLAQLKSVVEELAKLPGGRTLLLVSDGFSLQPAREFYAVVAPFLPKDTRFKMPGPSDLESKLEAVIKVAVERNVRIYSVDSRGLAQSSFASSGSMDASAPPDRAPQSVILRGSSANRGGTLFSGMDRESSSVAFQNGSGMEQLAQSTGGVYFHDSNDMLSQFRSALADGREYYLLAYVPSNRVQDGKFRSIAVEVAGKNLHVRAKSGYWTAATEGSSNKQ